MGGAGLTADLVREVLGTSIGDVPQDCRDAVRDAILDDVGIAFLGFATAGEPVAAYARDVGAGVPESTLVGTGERVSCQAAAGANAQLANETNFNESGPGHHILSPLSSSPGSSRPASRPSSARPRRRSCSAGSPGSPRSRTCARSRGSTVRAPPPD